MKRTLERITLTLFITFIYGWTWVYLENIIYGAIENIPVGIVMIILFTPFIYIATDKFIN